MENFYWYFLEVFHLGYIISPKNPKLTLKYVRLIIGLSSEIIPYILSPYDTDVRGIRIIRAEYLRYYS